MSADQPSSAATSPGGVVPTGGTPRKPTKAEVAREAAPALVALVAKYPPRKRKAS